MRGSTNNHIAIEALEPRIVFSLDLVGYGPALPPAPLELSLESSTAPLHDSSSAVEWRTVATGDFNNDGHVEVLGVRDGQWWLQIHVTATPLTHASAGTQVERAWGDFERELDVLGLGDFNNDGWLDLLSLDSTNGKLILHANGRDGFDDQHWGHANAPVGNANYMVSDFDNDGLLDLLSENLDGQRRLALNSGHQLVWQNLAFPATPSLQQLATGQFDIQTQEATASELGHVVNIGPIAPASKVATNLQVASWNINSTDMLSESSRYLVQSGIGTLAAGEGAPTDSSTPIVGPLLPGSMQITIQTNPHAPTETNTQQPDIPIVPLGAAQATVDLDGDDSSGVAGSGFINTFTEEDGYVRLLDTDFSVDDQGEDDITEIVVQPTGGVPDGNAEFVIFRRTGGVSSVRLDGSETTVFTNSATDGVPIAYQFDPSLNAVVFRPDGAATFPIATVRLLMDGLRYYNTDDDPDTGDRIFDIFLNDNSSVASTVGRATVQVAPVNDAPVLDLDADDSSGAAAVVLGRDSVDLTFASSTNVTGTLFNGDTISVSAPAIFSSGFTATDPAFVASYFERTEGMRINDNTAATITFSNGAAPTGTLLVFHDVDQNESVTIQSNSGTPLFVEQAETTSGETTTMPTWNPVTGQLIGDAQNGVGGATIFDVSGLSDLTLNVGTPGTLGFGFVTPGLHPINYETSFTEGGGPVGIVDSDVDASDVDDSNVDSVTITLTNGQIGDQFLVDTGAITALGLTISGPTNSPLTAAGPLSITLQGPVTQADLESALSQVQFENTSLQPDTRDRTIALTSNDSQAQSLTAESVVRVTATATDLAISKTDNGDRTEVGDVTTYTITVENISTTDSTGVVITETLPADTVFNSSASTSGWSDAGGGSYTFNVGSLQAGDSTSVDFAVELQSTSQSELANTVSVADDGAAGPELDSSNNTASDTTPINESTASLSGTVFSDENNNGILDSGEAPISGVAIALAGTTSLGNSISQNATTDGAGEYSFADLPAGTYTVTETQPAGFLDGQENSSASSSTSIGADAIQIVLGAAATETVTFGETVAANSDLSKQDLVTTNPDMFGWLFSIPALF